MESHITLPKISILQQNSIKGNFDFEHYKAIHKFLANTLIIATIQSANGVDAHLKEALKEIISPISNS